MTFCIEAADPTYKFGSIYTNKHLLLEWGNQSKKFKMDYVSNSDFTQTEFHEWLKQMRATGKPILSPRDVDNKVKRISKFVNAKRQETQGSDAPNSGGGGGGGGGTTERREPVSREEPRREEPAPRRGREGYDDGPDRRRMDTDRDYRRGPPPPPPGGGGRRDEYYGRGGGPPAGGPQRFPQDRGGGGGGYGDRPNAGGGPRYNDRDRDRGDPPRGGGGRDYGGYGDRDRPAPPAYGRSGYDDRRPAAGRGRFDNERPYGGGGGGGGGRYERGGMRGRPMARSRSPTREDWSRKRDFNEMSRDEQDPLTAGMGKKRPRQIIKFHLESVGLPAPPAVPEEVISKVREETERAEKEGSSPQLDPLEEEKAKEKSYTHEEYLRWFYHLNDKNRAQENANEELQSENARKEKMKVDLLRKLENFHTEGDGILRNKEREKTELREHISEIAKKEDELQTKFEAERTRTREEMNKKDEAATDLKIKLKEFEEEYLTKLSEADKVRMKCREAHKKKDREAAALQTKMKEVCSRAKENSSVLAEQQKVIEIQDELIEQLEQHLQTEEKQQVDVSFKRKQQAKLLSYHIKENNRLEEKLNALKEQVAQQGQT